MRVMRHGRPRALGFLGCLALLAACGTTSAEDAAAPQAVSTTATVEPANALSETVSLTTIVQVPTYLVDDCVDYVQFGAWTGNAALVGLWNDAARDVPTLRANCAALGRANPGDLQEMSSQWTDVETYIAASEAAIVATTPPPLPTTPPTTRPQRTSPPPIPASSNQPQPEPDCGDGSYVNVDGDCISGPVAAPSAPAGATAQCNDGTYSFSQHRSGTCSHHHGVAVWL